MIEAKVPLDLFLSTKAIIELVSEADKLNYKLIKGKKVMFESSLSDENQKCLCVIRSRFHDTIYGYWCDITEKQKIVLEKYVSASIIFNLEGPLLTWIDWKELRIFLTDDCAHYNEHEGKHWKIYIIGDELRIRKSNNKITLPIIRF